MLNFCQIPRSFSEQNFNLLQNRYDSIASHCPAIILTCPVHGLDGGSHRPFLRFLQMNVVLPGFTGLLRQRLIPDCQEKPPGKQFDIASCDFFSPGIQSGGLNFF